MPTATCPAAHVVDPYCPSKGFPSSPRRPRRRRTGRSRPGDRVRTDGEDPARDARRRLAIRTCRRRHIRRGRSTEHPVARRGDRRQLGPNAPTIPRIAAVLAHLALIAAPASVDRTAERYREHREPPVIARAFSDAFERRDQLDALAELSYDMGQGFYLGRPLDGDASRPAGCGGVVGVRGAVRAPRTRVMRGR